VTEKPPPTNKDDWQRLFDQTSDPDERSFYRTLHRLLPEVTVEWKVKDGQEVAILHGIGLKKH
jgi:hypothetical protein